MGSGQSATEKWVDEIPVPFSKPTYPPPEPPTFFIPSLLKNYPIRDIPDNTEGNMNWKQVRDIVTRSLDEQADIETGKIKQTQASADEKEPTPGDGEGTINEQTVRNNSENGLPRNNSISNRSNLKGCDTEAIETENSNAAGTDNTANVEKQQPKKLSRNISFGEIDQYAREAQSYQGESFSSLFDYLSKGIPETRYRDVYLVRGITAWLCNQDIASLKPETASLATPAGLVQHVKNKSLSITSAYALLIRAASIPCVIVHGGEKGGHYNPGDPVQDMGDTYWCAVHVDKSWQLIHPTWTCRGTYDTAKESHQLVLIEDDSQKEEDFNDLLKSLNKPDEPQVKFLIQDDYFMPKPDTFRYKCHPYDRKWSLLTKGNSLYPKEEFKSIESTLSSKELFKMQVCLSPAFFKLNLRLVSQPYSTLMAETGTICIEFEVTPELGRTIMFKHELSVKDVGEAVDMRLKPENISRLVLYHRCNNRAMFEIGLPCRGSYLFIIQAGMKDKFYNVCKFLLASAEDHDVSLLPVDAGIDGWGPGPKTQTAGLLVPSRPKGVITYQPVVDENTKQIQARHINITFDISREFVDNTDYKAEIIQSPEIVIEAMTKEKNSGLQIQDWLTCTKDRLTRTLDIDVMVPKDGVYALVIRSTKLEDKPLNMKTVKQGTTTDVCYYLLKPFYAHTRQGPKMKFAKAELLRSIQGERYIDMNTAVDRCLLLGIGETNEDIAACQVKMEYMKLKTDITECIKRRNLSVLNDTLLQVLRYRYRAALVDEVEALLDFRKKILAIDGYQMCLPSIREAIDEMYKMPHVRPEVHNTIAALLALLRHPLDKLEDWSYVKTQLRSSGAGTGNLAKQIEMSDSNPEPPDISYIRLADQILHQYTFPQVLHVNHSAATFYKWVEAITIRLKEYDRAQRKYEEKRAIRQAEIDRIKADRTRVKQAKKHKHKHGSF